MPNRLDHFMWAGPDLEAGIAAFETLTGIRAGKGGVHPGMGTRNALASLGPDTYVELIAPDPAQKLDGTFGATFATLARPQVFAFIAKSADLAGLKKAFAAAGIETDGPFEATRALPSGGLLRWKLLVPKPNRWGVFAPFFIDWLDSPHPATTSTPGCKIVKFELGHPEAEALVPLYKSLDMAFAPVRSDAPFLRATIETPKGPLVLTSA